MQNPVFNRWEQRECFKHVVYKLLWHLYGFECIFFIPNTPQCSDMTTVVKNIPFIQDMMPMTLNYVQANHRLCHNYTSVSCLIKMWKRHVTTRVSTNAVIIKCNVQWPPNTNKYATVTITIQLQAGSRTFESVMIKVCDGGTCRSVNLLSLLKAGKEPKCSSVKHFLWLLLQITPY